MRVQDVMTKSVETISPHSTADAAWNLMRAKAIHHLVVTIDSRVAGVLSDLDMGGRQGSAIRAGRTVADIMTERVATIEPAATLRKAANMMRGRSTGCLVVTDNGRIVGIVTVADLLDLLGRGVERPVVTTHRWTLKHRAPHRKTAGARGVW